MKMWGKKWGGTNIPLLPPPHPPPPTPASYATVNIYIYIYQSNKTKTKQSKIQTHTHLHILTNNNPHINKIISKVNSLSKEHSNQNSFLYFLLLNKISVYFIPYRISVVWYVVYGSVPKIAHNLLFL